MAIEQKYLGVTETSDSVSFSETCYHVEINNAGSNSCYISVLGTVTTDHFLLQSGETLTILGEINNVYAICAAGNTTTLAIVGTKK